MFAPAVIASRKRSGKRFISGGLRSYYIDFPGCGIAGGNVSTGITDYVRALIDPNNFPGEMWRRDGYFWFDQRPVEPYPPSPGLHGYALFKYPLDPIECFFTFEFNAPPPDVVTATVSVNAYIIEDAYDSSFSHAAPPTEQGGALCDVYDVRGNIDPGAGGSYTITLPILFDVNADILSLGNIDVAGCVLRVASMVIDNGGGAHIDSVEFGFGQVEYTDDPSRETFWPNDGWYWFWDA